jgi:hypothetical protein
MNAYRETFRKHRILFWIPPVLATLALAFLAFTTPKKYQAQASLWIDNGPLAGTSLSTTSATQPSSSEQTILNELVATKSFAVDVANRSLLGNYIRAQGGTKQEISGNLAAAVMSGVSVSTPGPQILLVTFIGPSPAIAHSALQSLIAHLQSSMAYYGQTFGQSAQAYYEAQVKTATQALTRATGATNAYRQSHPGVTATNDQNYAALVAAQQSDAGQLATATGELNQAVGQATGGGTSTLVRLVDPPSFPTTATSGKTKMVEEVAAGFFGGWLLSAIVIVAMTPSRRDRWDDEISGGAEPANLAQVTPQPEPLSREHTMPQPQAAVAAAGGVGPQSTTPRSGVWALQRRILTSPGTAAPERLGVTPNGDGSTTSRDGGFFQA